MKKYIIFAIATLFLSVSAYADDHTDYKCDYKYYRGIQKVNSVYKMTDEAKERWTTKLKEVHQLCMDGKDAEASNILKELRSDKDWDTVFSTYDSN
jgi:hypothetical protein